MGKIVSIDFGLKRTGIALSDDTGSFAFGLETVESRLLMKFLIDLKVKEKFTTIVLGMPKRLNNEDSHVSENVRLLKEALEKQFAGVKVDLMDERFTSKMASESMFTAGASKKQRKEKGLIDKVSATIILQSYISQQSFPS
ncbi:MAG: putative Holliday junction resolvase [Crocinitomicaceae bacterium]|jgi:putative Holliday junction resolvase